MAIPALLEVYAVRSLMKLLDEATGMPTRRQLGPGYDASNPGDGDEEYIAVYLLNCLPLEGAGPGFGAARLLTQVNCFSKSAESRTSDSLVDAAWIIASKVRAAMHGVTISVYDYGATGVSELGCMAIGAVNLARIPTKSDDPFWGVSVTAYATLSHT